MDPRLKDQAIATQRALQAALLEARRLCAVTDNIFDENTITTDVLSVMFKAAMNLECWLKYPGKAAA